MKKLLKKTFVFIGLILITVVIYYSIVILNARANTPAIVNDALNSGRMKLELNDLTNEQIQALLKVQDQNFYNHKGFDILYSRDRGHNNKSGTSKNVLFRQF